MQQKQYLIDHPETAANEEYEPGISMCLPTLNDAETLERSLRGLQEQNYDDLEIIVIDGYSDDGTVSIAEKYADKVIFDEENYGSACRKGVMEASNPIIGLFDGDIYYPHEDWLRGAVQQFTYDDKVSTVWPKNQAPPNSSLLTKLYFEHWDLIIEDRIESGRGYYGGGNSLFRRESLEDIGGVDSSIHWGADFDWAKKLKESGYSVVYHRDPIYHHTMRGFRHFYSKQFSGASTFSDSGFEMMGMTFADVLFEQVGLGLKGMVKGLAIDRKLCWALYPFYLFLRSLAYGIEFSKSMIRSP